ncbi:MAG TPA: sigma-70 family RNA polymerase sigma factor [Acidimicrobiales bacterium]|nr:sigma-70 family RNA polymerase sigma factor [Acidimicrobiales bacterium]
MATTAAPDGFEAAFPDLFALGYRVAFRILGDGGDAEDVAQEALARAVVRWTAVQDRAGGWVARVAANLAIDRYRRRRRSGSGWSGPGPDWVADRYQPERLDLARALRRLPRRQREVVVLRYLADWSEQDVAASLGCSVGTVKSHGARGLGSLRRALSDGDPGRPGGAAAVPREGVGDVHAP